MCSNHNSTWTLPLTQWDWVIHICIGNVAIIGSNNGLSPGRCQAIIWTNAGILLIGPLGTNFSETLIEIHTFSFMKMYLKWSSVKWRPFCLGLNVLIIYTEDIHRKIWSIIYVCNYLSLSQLQTTLSRETMGDINTLLYLFCHHYLW